MREKSLTLICVQPCKQFYAWQVEVMLTNFESLKIHEHYKIQCLFPYNKSETDWQEKVAVIKKVEQAFKNIAEFFYYEDTRQRPFFYISGSRPNALKQHLKLFPELGENAIFYHDCDMVFTKFPDFFQDTKDDDVWYLSDTISYIGHDYILSKGEEVLDTMCDIVEIDKDMIKRNQPNSGGAQYLMKNLDSDYFEKVEKDCENLFNSINKLSESIKIKNPQYHELQIWCADMWAVLWNAWLHGHETLVIPDMNFCWATDVISKWYMTYIFHNAGVTDGKKSNLFFKPAFTNKLPYSEDFSKLSDKHCSKKYVDIITSIGNKSCLYEQSQGDNTILVSPNESNA